jgi:hypothetical protein
MDASYVMLEWRQWFARPVFLSENWRLQLRNALVSRLME